MEKTNGGFNISRMNLSMSSNHNRQNDRQAEVQENYVFVEKVLTKLLFPFKKYKQERKICQNQE